MPGDGEITKDLMGRLERHYIRPGQIPAGGVFLPEVGWNAVGGTSRADALYVGFTSASGRLLIGHEVKASRADWLAELNKPGKADGWADQCHAWYLVTVPGVVHDGELPFGWGLMQPGRSRTRMEVVTPAIVHRDRVPGWDATRSIIARLDTVQGGARERIREEERAKVADQIEAAEGAEGRWRDHFANQTEHVRGLLEQVNKALGCRVVEHDRGSLDLVGPKLLEDLGALLGHHASLQGAVEELAGRYSGVSTTEVRAAIDHLDDALRRAREGLPPVRRDRW